MIAPGAVPAPLPGSHRRVADQLTHGQVGLCRHLGDLLGVNELHGSQYWSLAQLTGLLRSYEVGARRTGCCPYLLYDPCP